MAKGETSRPHIGIFGRRNNGKSSIINAIARQDIAIVSNFAGTTTDPVKKSMEITGLGPVIIIDTAGIDDVGELGEKRIAKTEKVIREIDLAILVLAHNQFDTHEIELIEKFNKADIPFFVIHNKSDIAAAMPEIIEKLNALNLRMVQYSTVAPDENYEEIISLMRELIPESAYKSKSLLGDLISAGDVVLLITPIDIEAPEGRLILPQVQTIRDVLDNDCIAVTVKERDVDAYLKKMQPKPSLVVTDSQVFLKADASIPKDIPLTSFSILLARQKGDFYNYIKGTPHISQLQDGDKVLLLESCSHHTSCDDIGRVKIPRWISNFTGKKLTFEMVAGLSQVPRPIDEYALVIQCGGCMITTKQLTNRLKPAIDKGISVTNYGMAIAYVQGIFNRAVAPFLNSTDDNIDYL